MLTRDTENPTGTWDMEGCGITEEEAITRRAEIPAEAWKIYLEGVSDRIPTGFAYHKNTGWCVLMCGQGPMFAY